MKHCMNKRLWSVILAVLLVVVLALCITACKKSVGQNADSDSAPTDTNVTPGGDGSDSGGDGSSESGEDLCEGEHTYGEGVVTKEPTCAEEGVTTYTCTACGHTKTEAVEKVAHVYGNWETVTEPTINSKGSEHRICSNCGHEEIREIAMLPATYYITIDLGNGQTVKLGVGDDGVYTLEEPSRVGYAFIGWVDAEGNSVAATGTIGSDMSITAKWELLATTTLAELIERAAAGTDVIRIANDIVIDQPIFITGKTKLYAETPVKLIRDPNYAGDLFVIGQTSEGVSSILEGSVAELTLGDENGSNSNILLTVDGNSDKMAVNVVGSAMFLVDGGCVNLYDGVLVTNHKKVGNERLLTNETFYLGSSDTVGGAAFMVSSGSSLHMYGGIISNNSVNTMTSVDENGEKISISTYGGAIYNCGTFRMYGGVISGNSANRGGGIYTSRVIKIYGGILENNYAENKGAAICSSGSATSDTFIGSEGAAESTVIFRNNTAKVQGGAILSYYNAPVVIYDGVLFEGNVAQSGNGGAISTTGTLTVYNSVFRNNMSGSKGGAIYHSYSTSDALRELYMEGCILEGNRANKGGAVIVTSVESEGPHSVSNFINCQFINNTAYQKTTQKTNSETGEVTTSVSGGNGGAIYSSQRSVVTIKGCDFTGNKAENLGGGAIGATVSSVISISDSSFNNNAAIDADGEENGVSGVGGAMYVYNKSNITVTNTSFTGNSAAKNGGAIYTSDNTVTMENVEFHNNSAMNGGVFAHYSGSVISVKGIVATGNSATNYGGIVYNSKSTFNVLSGEGVVNAFGKLGANDEETLALQNVATSGGAIFGGTNSFVNVSGATFANNAAIGEGDTDYKRYGGAICGAYNAQFTVDNVKFEGNSGKYGGAVSLLKNATLKLDNSTMIGNTTTNCGGGMYVLGASAELTNITATDNTSAKGGVLYLSSQSNTKISNSTLEANSATYGGAVYVSGAAEATFESNVFKNNGIGETKPGVNGGAFYIVSADVTVNDCDFDGNVTSGKGGAFYLVATETNTNKEGVETKTAPAIVRLTSSDFTNNNSKTGGAIYASTDGEVYLTDITFSGNAAKPNETDSDARGGAIYTLGAKVEATNVDFDSNTAAMYGGAIDAHTNSVITLTNVTFTNNHADNNGGALWAYLNTKVDITGITATGNSSGAYGGFTYTRGEMNIISGEGIVNIFGGAEEALANTSVGNGGVISGGVDSVINVSGTQFIGNSGKGGGAIHSVETMIVDNCTFTDNTAHLTDVTSTKAVYRPAGAAVYAVEGSNTTLTNCTFTSNIAYVPSASTSPDTRIYGGAVCGFSTDTVLTIANCTFEGNGFADPVETLEYNAKTYGGAIGVTQGVALTVNGSSLENNSAKYGGAISAAANDGIKVMLDDVTLTNNLAGSCGGAIYLNTASAEMNKITATLNEAASTGGGAIYASSCSGITLTNSEIAENYTGANGGAIFSSTPIDISATVINKNESKKSGGALYLSDSATINGCIFNENTAGTNGGAIYLGGGTTSTVGCSFENNTAGYGGAIYVAENATLNDGIDTVVGEGEEQTTVENTASTFKGNSAKTGGAIYLASVEDPDKNPDNVAGIANLEAATFEENTVTTSGGAIYAGKGAVLTDNGSTYNKNLAYRGGAVYLAMESVEVADQVKATFTGSTFTSNETKQSENTEAKARGGAIYAAEYLTFRVIDSKFEGNTAEQHGGAINVANTSNLEMSGSTLTENVAGSNGGAIWLYSGTSINVDNSTFTKNSAGSLGGAISSYNVVIIKDSTFSENSAKSGGAIYLYGSATLTDGIETSDENGSTFTANTSAGGGAIYTEGTVTLHGSIFSQNSAVMADVTSTESVAQMAGGGAISAKSGAVVTANGCDFISNVTYAPKTSTIPNNTRVYGGAISVFASELNINGGKFEQNVIAEAAGADDYTPRTYGGAIGAYNGSVINLTNGTTFTANKAAYGGAVSAATNKGNLISADNVTFTENEGSSHGGAIYLNDANTELKNVTATGNITNGSGGVLYSSSGEFITVTDSNLSNNEAKTSGGAIFASAGTVTTVGSTFTENTAGNKGGAIYIAENVTLSDGVDTVEGEGTEQTTTVNASSTFDGNVANFGGAIYLAAVENPDTNADHVAGIATLEGTRFEKNTSKTGGAIYAAKGTELYLNDIVFDGNIADYDSDDARGGAIYTLGATVEVNNVQFNANTATKYGGAIDAHTDSKLTLTNVTFTNNHADNNGGAVWAYTNTQIDITGVTATGNSSGVSGGFAYTRGIMNIISGEGVVNVFGGAETALANTAVSYGGAISGGASSTVTINGAQFIGNSAKTGGAIHSIATLSVTDSAFTDNKVYLAEVTDTDAVYVPAGAAVYATSGANTTLAGCEFVSNIAYVPAASTSSDTRIYGAAVCGFEKDTVLTVDDCTFNDNGFENPVETLEYTVKTYGGAIGVSQGVAMTVTNSTLENNTAKYGGAISVAANEDVKVVIDSVTLTKNIADSCGGAIYLNGTSADMNKITATLNEATSTGGGAIYASACKDVTLTNSEITENSGSNGGAIYTTASINITDTLISNNEANKAGGAIYVGGGTTSTDGCTFENNTAGSNGGAIYIGEGTVYNDNGSTYNKNVAYRGGAVHIAAEKEEVAAEVKATFTESVFTNNEAVASGTTTTARGGAIYSAEYLTFKVVDSTFTGNTAVQYGGAISVARGANLDISGSTLTENTSGTNGGAIWLYSESSIDVDNCTFTKNSTGTNGGAIYSYNTVTVNASTFTENSATNGGAIYFTSASSTISDKGSTFEANVAANGGAIYVAKGTADMAESIFKNNTVTVEITESTDDTTGAVTTVTTYSGNGGAIYLASAATLVDRGSTYIGNIAENGGAVYADGAKVDLGASNFEGNTALMTQTTIVTTTPSEVEGEPDVTETATTYKYGNGGAIYVAENGTLKDGVDTVVGEGTAQTVTEVAGSTFKGNVAASGGAIYTLGAVTTNDSDFDGNTVTTSGGAIAASGATLNITGGTMSNNTVTDTGSSKYGGAIHATGATQAVITGTVFTGNSAYSGGAISSYAAGTSVTMNQVELAGNNGQNGTIYIGGGGAVTVTDLNAHDNNNKGNGAVVYTTSAAASTLTVNSATLSGNTDKNGLGFVMINNAKNVLNINKSQVTGADVNDNWDVLILNSKGATVNELPLEENVA